MLKSFGKHRFQQITTPNDNDILPGSKLVW